MTVIKHGGQTLMSITGAGLDGLGKALAALAGREVLVGFPENTTARDDDTDGGAQRVTNAMLGYVHDNGMPEQNIPARPFMKPGIAAAESPCADHLGAAARVALQGGTEGDVEKRLMRVGITAVTSIKRKINEGIPPPLSEVTLRKRANRSMGKNLAGSRKGAKAELAAREAGVQPSTQLAKPLVDTGGMRNAVTYVIRDRSDRER